MTIKDIKDELLNWKLSKYKILNFSIGVGALLIYEFIARPLYRPFIYSNNINDFHIADTLGNSLGTIATIFIMISIFSHEMTKSLFLVKIVTLSLCLFELAQPLLGKPIDLWDILATVLTGGICYFLYKILFSKMKIKDPN